MKDLFLNDPICRGVVALLENRFSPKIVPCISSISAGKPLELQIKAQSERGMSESSGGNVGRSKMVNDSLSQRFSGGGDPGTITA
ncbi:hypothetical protein Sjap_006102 [Stephania japonica]|uniref:Uncharacterized protein n=1 Tax=Stephania japonica TaxID=461633 RepID=A0AAP0PKQ9_9MAGN